MLEYLPKRSRFGGLRLEPRKRKATQRAIRAPFIPKRLLIPIERAGDAAPAVCVEIGARVLKSQTIAAGTDATPDVHASSSGRVAGIEIHRVVSGGELRETPCVVIETDGKDEAVAATQPPTGTHAQIEHIHRNGIVGLGGAAFSTALKITHTRPCKSLVINGAECEPYISCDDMLMRERAAEVVAGSLALCDLASAEECIIAIERDKPSAINAMKDAARAAADSRIKIAEIPSIYPAGGERQLIDLLTALEVPSGKFPSHLGILCQNVGTAYAVHRALAHAEPLVSRIVTVTGAGVAEAQNVEALIGTQIADLIEHCGGYTDKAAHLIIGGSMMGISIPIDTTPVSKSTNCVLVASTAELPTTETEWPCIRCGECALVCPAYLLPQSLLIAARKVEHERLDSLGLVDCIECGCCDAVCPSHIRLTEAFRKAKAEIKTRTERAALAEESHQRFAARTQRLERDREVEREEQSRMIARLGDDASERQRSIKAAAERARKRRGPSDDGT